MMTMVVCLVLFVSATCVSICLNHNDIITHKHNKSMSSKFNETKKGGKKYVHHVPVKNSNVDNDADADDDDGV